MLSLDQPHRHPDATALTPPGGFVWWYVDALDSTRSGFVCIWSFGLPFLPGLASAARAGRGPAPGARPSVNLAIYKEGRAVAWHLLELDPSEVKVHPARWDFGPCSFVYEEGRLSAELTLPVPGSPEPLIGSFSVTGAPARVDPSPHAPPGFLPDAAASPHRWTPLLPHARAQARFTHGAAVVLELDGAGYHDRNESPLGLDALRIDHWTWGRAALPDRTIVWYLSWSADQPEPLLVLSEVLANGGVRVHQASVSMPPPRRATFGMPWWPSYTVHGLDHGLEVTVDSPPDDGPFYLRAPVTVRFGDATGYGWTELCRPARVDRAWERPLIAMCLQRTAGAESMWLPLFAGPHAGRWGRLAQWWTRGRPGAGPSVRR
jgi:carotenoid 1,2-hydratase